MFERTSTLPVTILTADKLGVFVAGNSLVPDTGIKTDRRARLTMATATLKKTDTRYNLRQDPRELAVQYRLALQPRKQSMDLINRARNRKTKGGGSSGGGGGGGGGGGSDGANHSDEREQKTPQPQPTPHQPQPEGHDYVTAAAAAMYLQTKSWGKMDEINDDEFHFDGKCLSTYVHFGVLVCTLINKRPLTTAGFKATSPAAL